MTPEYLNTSIHDTTVEVSGKGFISQESEPCKCTFSRCGQNCQEGSH